MEARAKHLLRDHDAVYGECFQGRVRNLGIDQVLAAPRSPWQNAYAEHVIGSIRRECLDHVVILSAAHLRRLLTGYFHYYYHHRWRTYLSLAMGCPDARSVQPPEQGAAVAFPEVG